MSASPFIYALIAGLLPSLIWLWFWLREDREHPEPRWLILATFVGGMLSVIAAIFGERYIAEITSNQTYLYTAWAIIEETVKFLAVAIIALSTGFDDEPIDAMIYCIVVALGFSALENALFIMGPLSNGEVTKSIITGDMRFIGATLVHIVSSASVGFALGWSYYKSSISKISAGLVGLAVAITLHAAFNLSIINANATETLKSFAWIWGAVVLLIVLFEEIKAVKPKEL